MVLPIYNIFPGADILLKSMLKVLTHGYCKTIMGRAQQFHNFIFCLVTFQVALSALLGEILIEASQVEPLNASVNAEAFYIPDSNTLPKRQLEYADAIQKGNRYWCILDNPAVTDGQSTYTQEKDLTDSGWTRAVLDVKSIILSNLQQVFDKEHINVLRSDCACTSWEHTKAKMNSQRKLIPATKGRYVNIYDVKAGVLIAQANFSPKFNPKAKLYPDVRAWSDVVFVEWQTQAAARNQDVKNLKWVIQYDITNEDTQNIIRIAAGGERNLIWPGVVLPMTNEDGEPNDAGRAILGTPNGVGVAYLLSTHRVQFGYRLIESVRVWKRTKDRRDYYLIFIYVNHYIEISENFLAGDLHGWWIYFYEVEDGEEPQKDNLGAMHEYRDTINKGDSSPKLSTYTQEMRNLPWRESIFEPPVSDATERH